MAYALAMLWHQTPAVWFAHSFGTHEAAHNHSKTAGTVVAETHLIKLLQQKVLSQDPFLTK